MTSPLELNDWFGNRIVVVRSVNGGAVFAVTGPRGGARCTIALDSKASSDLTKWLVSGEPKQEGEK